MGGAGGLKVQLLGAFRVELPNGRIAAVWSRPSGRRLFQMILLREGHRIGREEVAELLFPDLAPARAANGVSKALSIARSALAPYAVLGANRDVIWVDGPVDVDLERSCASLRYGLSLPPGDDRDTELTAGLACQGRLLDQELYADWAIAARDELEGLRSHAALELARDRSSGHGRQSLDSIIEAWRRVHARDQSNEEACSTLMSAYGGMGQRDQVVLVFHRTVAAIHEMALEVSEELKASYENAIATASPSGRMITLNGGPGPHEPFHNRSRGIRRPMALVGREAPLAELVMALDESVDDSRFVVIEGEPGIGKTRLADELRAIAIRRGGSAVWGRADEDGAAPALWPWLGPLRAAAQMAGEATGTAEELLAGAKMVSAGHAKGAQFERFKAVADVLERAGEVQPMVILLDDLQCADTTSLELLMFLADRLQRGVFVVATMRELELGRSGAVVDALAAIARRPGSRRLRLGGLGEDDTARLVKAAGGPSTACVIAAIQARAEGNPFYTIELSRLLDFEGGLKGEVPRSVGAVIQRRLGQLPSETVELLGVAAVIGREVNLIRLGRVAELKADQVLDAIEQAVVHRLLVEMADQPAMLRFSHALVRQALLDDMTAARRARLHLGAADAMQLGGVGDDEAEIFADHLWRAASIAPSGRAADALERASEVALRRAAYAEAEELLTRAAKLRRATSASLADQEAELLTLCRLLAVAQARRFFHGATDRKVLERGKELAERLERWDILVKLVRSEWTVTITSGRKAESDIHAARLRDLANVAPRPEVRAAGHSAIGIGLWHDGRMNEAAERLDIAMQLFGEAPPPKDAFDAEMRVLSQCFWIWTRSVSGRISANETFSAFDDLLLLMPDKFAVVTVSGVAGVLAIALGDWEATDHYLAMSGDADQTSQFAFWAGLTLMRRGVHCAQRGDLEEAVATFAQGRALYTGIGARPGIPTLEASVALHLARHGRVSEAQSLVESARAELEAYAEAWNEPVVLIAEAVVAQASGHSQLAAERLDRAVKTAADQGALAFVDRAVWVAAELRVPLAPA